MTNKPFWIGVEQEFQLMDRRQYANFNNHWHELERRYKHPLFHRSPTAVRTHVGSAMYADGFEPEICTPPVRIEKGFVQSAANALYLSRKVLVDFTARNPDLELIGFSTHWNFTDNWCHSSYDRYALMRALAVPFSLFSLTPLSAGINLRGKPSSGTPSRLELLTDYFDNEEQVRAFLLLYAGSVLGYQRNKESFPLLLDNSGHHFRITGAKFPNLVLEGRTSAVNVCVNGVMPRQMTAQAYLELAYRYLRKSIKEIGSRDDVSNLEEFISGRKELEIDKVPKYGFASFYKGREGGKTLTLQYHPSFCLRQGDYTKERPIPTALARFLGELVDRKIGDDLRIKYIDWDQLTLEEGRTGFSEAREEYYINGIAALDALAEVTRYFPVKQRKAVLTLSLHPHLFSEEASAPLSELGMTAGAFNTHRQAVLDRIEQNIPHGKATPASGAWHGDLEQEIARVEKKVRRNFPGERIDEPEEDYLRQQQQELSWRRIGQKAWSTFIHHRGLRLACLLSGLGLSGLITPWAIHQAKKERPILPTFEIHQRRSEFPPSPAAQDNFVNHYSAPAYCAPLEDQCLIQEERGDD